MRDARPEAVRPVEEISADDARRIVLRAQGLLPPPPGGDVRDMLGGVGAVQLDTISVLARSHELVAYARLGAVGRERVEAAYWGQPARAFEYYGHGNCVLPLEAWPYFAFRRRAQRERPLRRVATRTLDEVRARLREGPVTATDLGGARRDSSGWWNWSEAKYALEILYYRGEAVCVTRRAWKRVYDLPERALPRDVLQREPSDEECYRYLAGRAGRALGVATRRDIAEYFRLTLNAVGIARDAQRLLDDAIAECGLAPVRVEGWTEPAFADPATLALAGSDGGGRVALLSPFDSLIWERHRALRLFGFSLLLEAYKPRAQRVHGYFTMPLLAEGRLMGRVDPAREGRTLVARRVSLDDPAAVDAMAEALREAATWGGCDAVRVEHVEPRRVATALRRAVS